MANAPGINTEIDKARDLVTCHISIGDSVLGDDIIPAHVIINKSLNRIGSAKLVFHDGSASDREFTLSNDEKFKPGNKITIQLGYHGDASTVFQGIIIKHAIKIIQNGQSLLMIEAKDEAVKLTTARRSKNHSGKSDSDVITELTGGLGEKFDDTTIKHKHPQLLQFECTDWDFIVTRAEANGFLISNDDGKIKPVKPAISGSAILRAGFGENILEFEADMDARRQLKKITGFTWDYAKQEIEESKNVNSAFEEPGDISSSQLAEVLSTDFTLSHTGHLEQKQVQAWAESYVLRNKLSKAIGRVRVKGDAAVKPDTVITLAGVGEHFNGNVYVSGVLHQYDGTWYTDIQFGWKEEWFYHKENVMEKPAGGLLPGVNGLQIGKVQDTNDKDGLFRVKVYLATMGGKTTGIWARLALPDAGAEHGLVFRPQVGDEVVLGFLNDDPRDAIILGYLHSKGDQKSPLSADQKNLEYGVITKKNQKLVFNESKKMITIIASADSGEKTIILNDSDAIVLKDGFGNLIQMNNKGITISSDGEIIINGKTVRIN